MKSCLLGSQALITKSSLYINPRYICPQCCQLRLRSTSRDATLGAQYRPRALRPQSTWAQAVTVVQTLLNNGSKAEGILAGVSVDPLRVVGKEMKFLTRNIQQLLGSGHPVLDTVAKYYTQSEGKHIRPLLVLLMSQATSTCPKVPRDPSTSTATSIDDCITPTTILGDVNPSSPSFNPLSTSALDSAYCSEQSDILPSQRRLAEITELIHTASLLHDDVIDDSDARRGSPSANIAFGNKMAVLAGDFLLGRASVALARLRDAEVIELLATVIANLVEGEFMQLQNTALDERDPIWTEETISYYLQKTYLKSASLISKSCRAAALLGQSSPAVVEAAYTYGKNLGLAFQLVDDMLDYTISGQELGKPAGADLELGLATAPLLFAWKDNSEFGALVGRKFAEEGDVQRARELVSRSSGLEQTRALAQEYADKASNALNSFPASEAKDGLIEMCTKTMKRRK
ncbi:coq1 putative hexaprenyl diphosphate synthase [Xylographa soralifera]|nr:coq1 putative hexaprenyl diphosphate synthase [Xylographa soralifera]